MCFLVAIYVSTKPFNVSMFTTRMRRKTDLLKCSFVVGEIHLSFFRGGVAICDRADSV